MLVCRTRCRRFEPGQDLNPFDSHKLYFANQSKITFCQSATALSDRLSLSTKFLRCLDRLGEPALSTLRHAKTFSHSCSGHVFLTDCSAQENRIHRRERDQNFGLKSDYGSCGSRGDAAPDRFDTRRSLSLSLFPCLLASSSWSCTEWRTSTMTTTLSYSTTRRRRPP